MPLELTPAATARLRDLGLRVDEFEEQFVRSSGKGGQNVNKVSTAVCLVHKPTGLSVKVMTQRTQAANREEAWERLLDQLAERARQKLAEERAAHELERRRNRKPSRRAKARNVASKRHAAQRRSERRSTHD